jgi:hypothetical protein
MKSPTEKFQKTVIEAVTDAANAGVHPAIVYCVLGGLQSDVLNSIKQANRMAKEDAVTATADTIVKSQNSKPASPVSPATPANVIQLPKPDSTD